MHTYTFNGVFINLLVSHNAKGNNSPIIGIKNLDVVDHPKKNMGELIRNIKYPIII